jgi:hypothetical protein
VGWFARLTCHPPDGSRTIRSYGKRVQRQRQSVERDTGVPVPQSVQRCPIDADTSGEVVGRDLPDAAANEDVSANLRHDALDLRMDRPSFS